MVSHIANLVPQLSFVIFTLVLFITATPTLAQDSRPISESLELELALDDKDPTPECLKKHSAIACTPLRVTITNHADRGIGYVTSTCTHPRPFEFEFLSAAQKEWQDILLLRDLNDMEGCSGNVVGWVVIPQRGSVVFHTTFADSFSSLAIDKMKRYLPITIRARWDGGACFAAAEEEIKGESPFAFTHCAPNSPYEHIPSVTSNSLKLTSEDRRIAIRDLQSAA